MAALEHNWISGLLLMMLVFVLVLSILLVYLILRLRHHAAFQFDSEPEPETHSLPQTFSGNKRLAFKRLHCWLAIKNRNVQAVQSALALQHVKPCSWVDGLAGDSNQKLFISPPVSGWVLVFGSALPNLSDDEDVCFRFLQQLSRKLGHIQYFSASTILNQHAWVRMEAGHTLRAYAWAGRTLWTQGAVTAAEKELGMKCYDYEQAADNAAFDSRETGFGNSEKVHLLAARWSVNPDEIDEQFADHALGIVGEPIRNF